MTTDETDERDEAEHSLSADWHDDPEQGYCLLEYHWLRRYAALHHCSLTEAVRQMPKGDPVDVEEIVPRHVIVELNDVSPALTMAALKLNDALLADGPYQRMDLEPRLRALEPLLTNTDGQPDVDSRRARLALDWLIRDYLPTWLRITPTLAAHAAILTALSALTGPMADYAEAERIVREVKAAVAGIPSPGWDAASGAAQSAGVYVAWDAAEIGDADITAAVAADYAAEASETAARIAIQYMEPADAAAFLRPTVSALQDGALSLFERMLLVPGE